MRSSNSMLGPLLASPKLCLYRHFSPFAQKDPTKMEVLWGGASGPSPSEGTVRNLQGLCWVSGFGSFSGLKGILRVMSVGFRV